MLGSSPSQMIATWSPRASRCRSRQLKAAFNVPSSNHLIDTSPVKEVFLILVGVFIQVMRLHSFAQNASGVAAARAYISSYCALVTRAAATISGLTAIISASDISFPPMFRLILCQNFTAAESPMESTFSKKPAAQTDDCIRFVRHAALHRNL